MSISTVKLLGAFVLTTSALWAQSADINSDGNVDLSDLKILSENWLNELPNGDDTERVANPKTELSGDDPSIDFTRASNAIGADYEFLGNNVRRADKICVSEIPEVIVDTSSGLNLCVEHVDPAHNYILANVYFGKDFYRFTPEEFGDGSSFNPVKLGSIDDPQFSNYYANAGVQSMRVTGDGTWLLFMHNIVEGHNGYAYYSIDQGITWSQCNEYGTSNAIAFHCGVPTFGWNGEDGSNEIVIGTYGNYGNIDTANAARSVYYSDDYGKTWSLIHQPVAEEGTHIHEVCWGKDKETVYIFRGDPTGAGHPTLDRDKIYKIVYTAGTGGKHNIANWSIDLVLKKYHDNPTQAFRHSNFIYVGKDAGYLPVLRRINVNNDLWEDLVSDWTTYTSQTQSPYRHLGQYNYCFSICNYANVLYATVRCASPVPPNHGGILVSADGKNWCWALGERSTDAIGYRNIVGQLGGYMWGTKYTTTETLTGVRAYKIKAVRVASVPAITVGAAQTNRLTRSDAGYGYFENGNGVSSELADYSNHGKEWAYPTYLDWSHITSMDISTDEKLYGAHSMKIALKYNPTEIQSIVMGNTEVGPDPCSHPYLHASFWVRGGPDCNGVRIRSVYLAGNGTDVSIPVPPQPKMEIGPNCWRRFELWGKVNKTGDSPSWSVPPRLIFYIDYSRYVENYEGEINEYDDMGDIVLYFDCFQITYHANMWDSRPWQPGDISVATENAKVGLAGLTEPFTTSFVWRPSIGSRDITEDMPIATIKGVDNAYLYLFYDQSEGKLVITNGASTALTEDVNWEFLDNLKFVITSNGTDVKLYAETVAQGDVSAAILTSGALCELPDFLNLSTNNTGTSHGIGGFALIRSWDKELTSKEAQYVFDWPDMLLSR